MDGITFRLALSALVQLEQSQHQSPRRSRCFGCPLETENHGKTHPKKLGEKRNQKALEVEMWNQLGIRHLVCLYRDTV